MEVICLGTGTSFGIPMIACSCDVCTSSNPKNQRGRCSIVVRLPEGTLLIDTPPELRLACIRERVTRVDAVALTHTHSDHLMGMDDLRRFNVVQKQVLPVYAEPSFLDDVRRVFSYVFEEGQEGGGKPKLNLRELEAMRPVSLLGAQLLPLRVLHGELPITSFKIGSFAYVTDVSHIPSESRDELRNLDLLILSAIRDEPHSTHFNIPQALEVIAELRPRRAYLTHLTHDVDHEKVSARLPDGVALAYDGLRLMAADGP